MRLNKDDIYSLIGTVAFHGVILLILWFTVLKTEVPDEDGGVLVNFGNVDAAAGMFEPKYTGQEPPQETTTPPPPVPEPQVETPKQELITQDIEESVALEDAKKKKEEEKQMEVEEKKEVVEKKEEVQREEGEIVKKEVKLEEGQIPPNQGIVKTVKKNPVRVNMNRDLFVACRFFDTKKKDYLTQEELLSIFLNGQLVRCKAEGDKLLDDVLENKRFNYRKMYKEE